MHNYQLQGVPLPVKNVVHRSIAPINKGEITLVKPIDFRPFIKAHLTPFTERSARDPPVKVWLKKIHAATLHETNIAHENHHFPGKYHQYAGFSMAILVYRSVS